MKPILCVIDIQREYNEPGRPFFISGIESTLDSAKRLLAYARKNDWEVIHVQHLQNGQIFSQDNVYSQFIEGFEPEGTELLCTKCDYSSFSSPEFTKALGDKKDADILVIGYGSTMCCLSTIVDGYHRGYKFTFVADASNAKPTTNLSSDSLHNAAIEILKPFCQVKTLKEIVNT